MMTGCVTVEKASADRPAVVKLLGQWKDAFASKNMDAIMALYSENFKTGDRNKAAEAKAIKGELDDGLVDNAVITVDNATITIQVNKADVSPITFSGRTGSATMRLTLAKEQGRWLVIGMDDK
jgi:ketosteroid isomerase-like protein